jgi:hypothetical protein
MGRWMMVGYESVCELTTYTVASVVHEEQYGLMCFTMVFAEQRLLFRQLNTICWLGGFRS